MQLLSLSFFPLFTRIPPLPGDYKTRSSHGPYPAFNAAYTPFLTWGLTDAPPLTSRSSGFPPYRPPIAAPTLSSKEDATQELFSMRFIQELFYRLSLFSGDPGESPPTVYIHSCQPASECHVVKKDRSSYAEACLDLSLSQIRSYVTFQRALTVGMVEGGHQGYLLRHCPSQLSTAPPFLFKIRRVKIEARSPVCKHGIMYCNHPQTFRLR